MCNACASRKKLLKASRGLQKNSPIENFSHPLPPAISNDPSLTWGDTKRFLKRPLKRLSHSGLFLLPFFFYTMFHKIQRPLWVVVAYDILVWRSVLKKSLRDSYFGWSKEWHRKMVSSKCLQIILRQSNLGDLNPEGKSGLKKIFTHRKFFTPPPSGYF